MMLRHHHGSATLRRGLGRARPCSSAAMSTPRRCCRAMGQLAAPRQLLWGGAQHPQSHHLAESIQRRSR